MAIGDEHPAQMPEARSARASQTPNLHRRSALAFCAGLFGGVLQLSTLGAEPQPADNRIAWVAEVLTRMETIKAGMTREALLKVFTTEGGLSTGLARTFVSRDCPYFKVDVQFKAVGRPDFDGKGRVTLREDPRDLIVKISRPYLAYVVVN